jgi:hypothetical protein
MAMIMMVLTIFNVYRLLSPQAAGTRLDYTGSNVSLTVCGCMQAEFVICERDVVSRADPAISCLDHDRRPLIYQIE